MSALRRTPETKDLRPKDLLLPPMPTPYRNRVEIDDEYKWNLHDIFPNWEAWEAG